MLAHLDELGGAVLCSNAQAEVIDMFKPFVEGSGMQFEKLSGGPFWAETPAKTNVLPRRIYWHNK